MKSNTEQHQFMERVFTFRRLPLISISSKTARESDLDEEQIWALGKVVFAPKETFVSTIAEKLIVSTPKASRLVDSLVEANLVKRVYAELEDRRKIQLAPTEEGAVMYNTIREELYQTLREIMQNLGEKTKQLSDSLHAYNELMLSRMKSQTGRKYS